MATNASEDLSVTEPDLKKQKLDDGDNDEAETKTLEESFKQGTSSESVGGDKEEAETMETDSDSDMEKMIEKCTLRPEHFKSGELVEFCKLALARYENKHPGESYEFESGLGGYTWFNYRLIEYRLEFMAKNLRENGNPLLKFEGRVFYHPHDGLEEFGVEECCLLKDDEKEPEFYMDCMMETLLEDLVENESAKIVEFCKSVLVFYEEQHPEESYEFMKILKLKRWICKGLQYILVFQAKNLKVDTLATFKAIVYNLKRVVDIHSCELV